MPVPERYNAGYNVGVGGAVVHEGRILLVRRSSRRGRGNWQVPGGFVEPNETIEEAVVRKVAEESGINAKVQGLLGVRNRYDPDVNNSLYIVLLLHPLDVDPHPDNHEVDRAGFFTLEEVRALEQVPAINLEIAERALAKDRRLLGPKKVAHSSGAFYTLFVG